MMRSLLFLAGAAGETTSLLKDKGIDLTVVDVCAIKPCDEEGILKVLGNHELIFTAEEHNIIGGLGGLISEIASEKCPRKVVRIGVEDRYAESGPAKELMKKYKLDAEGVAEKIEKAL